MVVISGILPSFVLLTPKTLPSPLKQEPFLLSCFHTHIPAVTLFPVKGKEKAVNIVELDRKCLFLLMGKAQSFSASPNMVL